MEVSKLCIIISIAFSLFCKSPAVYFILDNKTKNELYYNTTNVPSEFNIKMSTSEKVLFLFDSVTRDKIEREIKVKMNHLFDRLGRVLKKLRNQDLNKKFSDITEDYKYLYTIYKMKGLVPKIERHKKYKIHQKDLKGDTLIVLRLGSKDFEQNLSQLFEVDDLLGAWNLDQSEDEKTIDELLKKSNEIMTLLKSQVLLEVCPLDLNEWLWLYQKMNLTNSYLEIAIEEPLARIDFPTIIAIKGIIPEDFDLIKVIWGSFFNVLKNREKGLTIIRSAETLLDGIQEQILALKVSVDYANLTIGMVEELIQKYKEKTKIKSDLNKIKLFIKQEKEFSEKASFVLFQKRRFFTFNQEFDRRHFSFPFDFTIFKGEDGSKEDVIIQTPEDVKREIILIERAIIYIHDLLNRYDRIDRNIVAELKKLRDFFRKKLIQFKELLVLTNLQNLEEYTHIKNIFSEICKIMRTDYREGLLLGKPIYGWFNIKKDMELIEGWIIFIKKLIKKYDHLQDKTATSYLEDFREILHYNLKRLQEIG